MLVLHWTLIKFVCGIQSVCSVAMYMRDISKTFERSDMLSNHYIHFGWLESVLKIATVFKAQIQTSKHKSLFKYAKSNFQMIQQPSIHSCIQIWAKFCVLSVTSLLISAPLIFMLIGACLTLHHVEFCCKWIFVVDLVYWSIIFLIYII